MLLPIFLAFIFHLHSAFIVSTFVLFRGYFGSSVDSWIVILNTGTSLEIAPHQNLSIFTTYLNLT